MAGGGGGAPALRFASALNRFPQGFTTAAGTKLSYWLRWPVRIGSSDMSSLKLSFFGLSMGLSAEANSSSYTITQAALERTTVAAYTPILFGGSRSKVINAGDYDIQSDSILPSSFGIAAFTQGDLYYMRVQLTVSAAALKIPASAGQIGTLTGQWSMWYDPATFTIANTDGTGSPGYSGIGFTFASPAMLPIVLGVPVNPAAKVWAGVGDSIVSGNGDTYTGSGYISFFGRALVDADLVSNVKAGCNFGYSGAVSTQWNSAPAARSMLKYATHMVEEYGTNGGAAVHQTASASIWSAGKAEGHKIIRTKLMAVATSTDSWATTVNQTKTAPWQPAGERVLFNTWIDGQTANFDTLLDFASVATDGGDRYLWAVNGSANYATSDGTHPSSSMHQQIAGLLRTAMASL